MEPQDMNQVTVVDVKMPFWSMVVFMVKWSIAVIPAILILAFVGSILFAVLGGIFNSVLHH